MPKKKNKSGMNGTQMARKNRIEELKDEIKEERKKEDPTESRSNESWKRLEFLKAKLEARRDERERIEKTAKSIKREEALTNEYKYWNMALERLIEELKQEEKENE